MAGEKTNTRQKMINMMYLVFIAMLALNIDKEVLATIGVINEDLETELIPKLIELGLLAKNFALNEFVSIILVIPH